MSSRYYLPLKQDVAKYVPKNFQKKENPNCNLACNETQFINRKSNGILVDVSITMLAKFKHIKPDLLIL